MPAGRGGTGHPWIWETARMGANSHILRDGVYTQKRFPPPPPTKPENLTLQRVGRSPWGFGSAAGARGRPAKRFALKVADFSPAHPLALVIFAILENAISRIKYFLRSSPTDGAAARGRRPSPSEGRGRLRPRAERAQRPMSAPRTLWP